MCKSGISGIMPYVESHGKFNVQTTSCYVVKKPASQRARSRVTGDLTLLKVNGQWYNRYHTNWPLDHLFRTTVHPKQGTGGAYTGSGVKSCAISIRNILVLHPSNTRMKKRTYRSWDAQVRELVVFLRFGFFKSYCLGLLLSEKKNQSIFNE